MAPVDTVAVNANILLWLVLTLVTTAGYVLMLTLAKPKKGKPQHREETQQAVIQVHEPPPAPAPPKREKPPETERREIEERLKKMEKTLDQLIESLSKTTAKEEQLQEKKEEEPVIIAKSLEGDEIIKAAEELKAEISKMASLMKR